MGRAHRLLFVCSGNICRSPMAEGLAPGLAAARGRAIEARSAGTLGIVGQPADPRAVRACFEVGVDIARHLSQGVTEELLDWADHVLVMEYAHAEQIRLRFPGRDGRTLLLGTFGGAMEIADPVGAWFMGRFRRARDEIRASLEGFLDRLPPAEEGRG